MDNVVIVKFAKLLRVTGVGVLIFGVNRSRIGVGFCNFGAGLDSESQKSDSGHPWLTLSATNASESSLELDLDLKNRI